MQEYVQGCGRNRSRSEAGGGAWSVLKQAQGEAGVVAEVRHEQKQK